MGWVAGLIEIKANSASQQSWSWGLAELGNNELEVNARTDPTAMWAALKKLNNFPDTKAALEIVRDDKTISNDVHEVLERWF